LNLLIIGLLGAIVVIAFSSRNWKLSVKTVLVLVIIEGALRKWALPQASQLIYFLKDFVLIGSYLAYFGGSRTKNRSIFKDETIKGLVYLIAIWCLFEIFNPRLGSPIIGVFGMRNYLLYIPLMWMLPSIFQSEEELYKYLRAYLLILIPVGLLAIAQYFSPPESPINVYAAGMEQQLAMSGDAVRVTGTFSYLAGYTTYLGVCFSLLLPLVVRQQTLLWRCLTVIELSLIAITSFMTGSRGLMIFLAMFLVSYFCLEGFKNFSSLINSFGKFLLPAILGFVLITTKFKAAVDTFEVRAENSEDILPRITGMFTEPFNFFQYAFVHGYGAGATFQANEVIRSFFNLPVGERIPVYFEGETGRIALELGMIGFLFWYGLKIVLLVAIWHVYRQLKLPFLKQLALSIFLFQSINITGQFVFNHSANLYCWFLNGFIFLLPQLELIESWKQNYYSTQTHDLSSSVADPSQQQS
jgi:hypothetical protein